MTLPCIWAGACSILCHRWMPIRAVTEPPWNLSFAGRWSILLRFRNLMNWTCARSSTSGPRAAYAALLPSSFDCPGGTLSVRARCTSKSSPRRTPTMMKITLAVAAAAAVLTTAPLTTPAKAQGVKMAQGVDVQVGRDRDDRYDRDRRRRYASDTTVEGAPGGDAAGRRRHCRMETTTIERDDGRRITRRERRCD